MNYEMNTILYQVYEEKEESRADQFHNTIVMNADELYRFLANQIKEGKIAKQNLLDKEVEDDDNIFDLDINIVFELLADNVDYGATNYYINQFEITINADDCYD